ncbi:MAG: family oxidoreductase [Anaerolineales bacterium]|nr:family oxidoreductase [Anaerolineales bacterium]
MGWGPADPEGSDFQGAAIGPPTSIEAEMLTDSGLAGKAVIVTGGSRGIGRAIVEVFSAEGADVTFFYRENRAAAAEVVATVRAAGRPITAERVDVRDAQGCAEAVERVAERCGHIDVLVNNAGLVRDGLLGLLGEDDVRTVLETNVGGVFNVTRAVVTHMIARRAGKIINISSAAGEKGGRGQTNYAASKGAINALTRALAVELAPRRITVNAVAPGVIETDMSEAIRDSAGEEVKARILLRRFGTAAEVAYAVWFLASRFADYITGEVLHVDGGFKME